MRGTLAVALALLAAPLAGQQGLPSAPHDATALDLRARAWLAGSGLAPAQVRARLAAAGYPPDLLDPYLAPAGAGAGAAPDDGVLAALRALGYADEAGAPADSVTGAAGTPRADLPAQASRIFGLDVFRRVTTQFQPAASGPVDAGYRLGPGDVLVLILTGDVELAHTLEVTREGFVVIPQVGQVYVAGLTLGQLDALLLGRLGRVYSGVRGGADATTRFQVTVARLRTVQVYVIGDVLRPGAFQVSGAGTILTALYLAGGPTDRGSLRRVLLRRGALTVDSLDVYDYLLRGDASRDRRLENGDVIFVPVRAMHVDVAGAVVRPATYELRAGETLRDLVAAAGGFEATALRRRLQIDRILPPAERGEGGRDRVLLEITAGQLADSLPPAVPLVPGDRVSVFAVADRQRRRVVVRGNVWNEGPVGLTPGMRLSEAIRLAGGPKPDVFLDRILVARLNPDSTRTQLRAAFRDSTGTVVPDLVLAEDDDIQVFSRTTFRPDRYVVVTGAVRRPGRVSFREGMTLRDAVLEARGLREDAWLGEAELARLPADRSDGVLATTLRVPLDSTYLFDRGPDGRWHGPPGAPAPARGAAEVALEPYDNVLILRQPDWELQRTVAVGGQVRFPGRYSLRTRTDRLTDLIDRAGGLTSEAYPRGAELYRRSANGGAAGLDVVGRLEARRADSAAAVDPLRLGTGLARRVGLDLTRALAQPGAPENLIVQEGDSLFVPEFEATVRVLGAVNAPTTVVHRQGWNLDRYVSAAGGFSQRADRGRAYVVQPGGQLQTVKRRFLLPDSRPEPLAGAVVFVPERDPDDRKDWAGFLGSLAQILASTVAIVVVATR
jgi:polysaccharide biosynthesis/export protein